MQLSIRENITLSNLREVVRNFFINSNKENDAAKGYADTLRIKTPGIEQAVEHLSGGNRQKVVLARWLFTKSSC